MTNPKQPLLFRTQTSEAQGIQRFTRKSKMRRLHEILGVARRYDALHLTPVSMRRMFEDLGPSFVKAGQILSMRSEILPQEYCDELAKLRADADPMPFTTVISTLNRELGRPVHEIFKEIDSTPLGSASLAQVHKATLLDGTQVAVKVQRPGVRETMAQDIDIMKSIVKRIKRFSHNNQIVDLDGVVRELWDSFREETDFMNEAQNLLDFRAFSENYAYLSCPKPYMDLCTPHVVTMDYIEGIPISHPERLIAAGYDLAEIGTKLVDNYAAQVLDAGFFHADPHPGNIIIADGKIVFIDLGLMGRITPKVRNLLKDMIFAVAARDSHKLMDGLLRLTDAKRMSPAQTSSLLEQLDRIISEYGTVDLQDLDVAEFINSLIRLCTRFNLEVPGNITMIARGLVTLEGVLDEFLPDANMIGIIKDHIANSTSAKQTIKTEVTSLGTEGLHALHSTLALLSEANEATHMLTRGELKANMELVGSEGTIRQLSSMVDRLTMALIVVGLYIGSSIVYYAGIKPLVFGIPIIGLMGYVVAFILSVWIVIDIFVQSYKLRKNSDN